MLLRWRCFLDGEQIGSVGEELLRLADDVDGPEEEETLLSRGGSGAGRCVRAG